MTLLNGASYFNHRQVLIFGKEEQELLVNRQLHLLQEVQAEVIERDITITVVSRQSELCARYKVKADEFTVVLVGKDNTEKLRRHQLLLPAELFAIIDAMPMRKLEMRKRTAD